jgi:hypothetical protein
VAGCELLRRRLERRLPARRSRRLVVVARPRTVFAAASERVPYAVFFVGMVLTAIGSAYYHLAPNNERLFWDRLPMVIAFMSLLAAQVVDRHDVRVGLALLPPLLLVGIASVLYWRTTERAGVGNVLPYAILQAYAVGILLLIALSQPSRYTRGGGCTGCSPATCSPRCSRRSTARSSTSAICSAVTRSSTSPPPSPVSSSATCCCAGACVRRRWPDRGIARNASPRRRSRPVSC